MRSAEREDATAETVTLQNSGKLQDDGVGAEDIAQTQVELRALLGEWHDKARALWELTAQIGRALERAHSRVPEEDWYAWLTAIGLTPYAAFVFMRATRYPELMAKHHPENLAAVARLLPQGQGEAFDAEQAQLARRLADAGLSKTKLRVRMGVSVDTLTRWLDPDKHAQMTAQKRERRQRHEAAVLAERDRRRLAAVKAKGGPGAKALSLVEEAGRATDVAWRSQPRGSESRRRYDEAIQAIYRARDLLYEVEAEGVR